MLRAKHIKDTTWRVEDVMEEQVEVQVSPAVIDSLTGGITTPAIMEMQTHEKVVWSMTVAVQAGGTATDAIALAEEVQNPPSLTEVQLRKAKFAALVDLRWQRETGGLDLTGGARIITTRESQSQIAATVQSINAGMITGPIDWKLASGWQQLSDAEVLAIGGAVADHVKRCFAAERAVSTQMEATTGDLSGFDIEAAFDAAYNA